MINLGLSSRVQYRCDFGTSNLIGIFHEWDKADSWKHTKTLKLYFKEKTTVNDVLIWKFTEIQFVIFRMKYLPTTNLLIIDIIPQTKAILVLSIISIALFFEFNIGFYLLVPIVWIGFIFLLFKISILTHTKEIKRNVLDILRQKKIICTDYIDG